MTGMAVQLPRIRCSTSRICCSTSPDSVFTFRRIGRSRSSRLVGRNPLADVPNQEPILAPKAPDLFDEVHLPARTMIVLTLTTEVDTRTIQEEEAVAAVTIRDTVVDGRVIIPAGTPVQGVASNIEPGGRIRTPAEVTLTFDRLTMPDGTDVRFPSQGILYKSPSPGRTAATRSGGGAAIGALVGGLLGGERGALIGGGIGAGAGAASAAQRSPGMILEVGTQSAIYLRTAVSLLIPE